MNVAARPVKHRLQWLRDLLAHPLAKGLDLDSPEATRVHARLAREKPFLRKCA